MVQLHNGRRHADGVKLHAYLADIRDAEGRFVVPIDWIHYDHRQFSAILNDWLTNKFNLTNYFFILALCSSCRFRFQ